MKSAQEPRCLASFSKDKSMIDAYNEGKDLYAVIASKAFHNNYENNLEFHPVTGKLQPDGKKRRSQAKTLQLAITYGMGTSTLAGRLNISNKEAQKFIDDFYEGFSGVKQFAEDSAAMVKKVGYVTDLYGRRRHLPDALLPEFEITSVKESNYFNPLLGVVYEDKSLTEAREKYSKLLSKARSKAERDKVTAQAKAEGYLIKNNGGFISRASRQTLNARIQGSAATMTKKAMINIVNDQVLKDLGFKLQMTVHDEINGEAPVENAEKVAKRVCEIMTATAKEKCPLIPWKCDPYITHYWYLDEAMGEVLKDYKKLNDIDAVHAKYPMYSRETVEQMCNETIDLLHIDKL